MKAPAALCLVFLLLAGCRVGMSAKKYRPAQGPEGIYTELTTMGGLEAAGELLEVRDEGLVLLAYNQVALVPFRTIRRASFSQARRLGFHGTAPLPDEKREQLRLASRFPQGLSDALLNRLLAVYDQRELRIVQ